MTHFKTPQEFLADHAVGLEAAGSRLNDFTIGSALRTLLESVSGVLSQQTLVLDQVLEDAYLDTATGDALDRLAANFGVTRLASVKSTGTMTVQRPATGAAITIPAGWAQLATLPGPGVPSVAIVTTEDVTLDTSDLSATVTVQAAIGGAAGNIDATPTPVKVIPTAPVSGIASDGGFYITADMTGGVDAETDEALRYRTRLATQGANNGTEAAYLAAALSVLGVTSAGVLKAGDAKTPGGTVAAGSVEVYYQGATGLLESVESACLDASVLNADVTVAQVGSTTVVIDCTVICRTGEDTVALDAAVVAALTDYIEGLGCGATVYISKTVEVIRAVPGVLSVNVPLTDHRKTADTDNTSSDITCKNDRAPVVDTISVTVTAI